MSSTAPTGRRGPACRPRRHRARYAAAAAVLAVVLVVVLVVVLRDTTQTLDSYAAAPWGDVLLMRHALAPGTGDPAGFNLTDCTTQRNLNADGRRQATRVGRLLADALEIESAVLSSQWCRCLDTADLIARELNATATGGAAARAPYVVQAEWGLNSFYQSERGGFTAANTIKRLEDSVFARDRADGVQTLMVTHQVTVSEVTGIRVDSGGIVAFDTQSGRAKQLTLSS